jgi:hypothetical protein
MAYSASGLHSNYYQEVHRHHCYQTTDAIAAVNSAGYFNNAAGMLNVRDLIIVMDTNTPTTESVSATAVPSETSTTDPVLDKTETKLVVGVLVSITIIRSLTFNIPAALLKYPAELTAAIASVV